MKEEEAIGAVPRVELVDPPARRVDERGVIARGGRVGVGKVRQQREVQVRVAVGEEPDLELVEKGGQPRLL